MLFDHTLPLDEADYTPTGDEEMCCSHAAAKAHAAPAMKTEKPSANYLAVRISVSASIYMPENSNRQHLSLTMNEAQSEAQSEPCFQQRSCNDLSDFSLPKDSIAIDRYPSQFL
jgi:hypothetical protein